MTRTAIAVVLAAALVTSLGVAPAAGADRDSRRPRPLAQAKQDGDDGKPGKDDAGKKEPDPKKTPEWKELTAIGNQFKAGDANGLVARVPRMGVTLRLGTKPGTYKPKQARGVLEQWFKERRLKKVSLEKMNGLTGDFALHVERTKRGVLKKKRLLITIEKKGGVFRLTKIQVI